MQIFKMKLGTRFLRLFLILSTVTTCITAADQSENKACREPNYRLPRGVILPWHYNINITISQNHDRLYCECNIDIQILKETFNIILHGPDTFNAGVVKLFTHNKSYAHIPTVRKISEECSSIQKDILELSFRYFLPKGKYLLYIGYVTNIEDREGFLKTSFQLEEYNEEYLLLATNTQSIEARKWFPCWDEPEYKATFRIRFHHDKKYKMWPVMPIVRSDIIRIGISGTDVEKNWVHTDYVIESPTSTYQVMFALTDLNLTSRCLHTSHPTIEVYKVNVFDTIWRRPGLEHSMKFADEVSDQILLSNWYKRMPTHIKDTNQLAIPNMQEDVIEQWRLILYKESLLTYDEKTDNSAKKREIARIIMHAMIHRFISNMITPSWWSDLWLTEGLASVLHMDALEQYFPGWRFTDLFVVQIQQDCFRIDRNYVIKPFSHKVETSSEIKSLFSFPIYVKAPVIMRMLRHIIGTKFQTIVHEFLNKYYVQSPKPDDLWNMMQLNTYNPKSNNTPTIKDIMETWVTQTNHPVVHIHRNSTLLSISQSRNVTTTDIDEDGRVRVLRHWIPITFTTSEQLDFDDTTPRHWITPEHDSTVFISINNTSGWIIINLKQTGYYRVKYDAWSLYLISLYLYTDDYQKIHVLNRAQLIDDTYYFLSRRELKYDVFVNLMTYMKKEKDYIVWYPMFQICRDISRFIPFDLGRRNTIKEDVRDILKGLLEHLTYTETSDEDDLTKRLRQEAARWACTLGDKKCQEIAHVRLEEHLEDPTNHKLSPEWREWTYCKGAMTANKNLLFKLIKLSYTNESKSYNYISCAEKPDLAMEIIFNSALNKGDNGSQLFPYFMFVDYSVKNISLRAMKYFNTHNIPDSDRVKLLFISIQHSFSETEVYQISRIKNYYFANSEMITNINEVVKKRLRQIHYWKIMMRVYNW